jgi:demethylmenaquinone methyltransferase/2-methoxy-6-polyprenyl-1,4-benzoquinol methylase
MNTEYIEKRLRGIFYLSEVGQLKSYNEKVKFQYKMLAKMYDLMDIIGFPIKKYNPRLGLARHIPNSNISILDVCSGTGNSSIAIAKKNNNNRIMRIDLSEDMLKVAQNKIKKSKLANITTNCMDATKIDMDEKFDIVTTSLSLHEMPQTVMDSVISEMNRVLKKNGKLYIIEWEKPKNIIGSIVFMLCPYIFEPKGFGDFLKLDWVSYLKKKGFSIESTEKYTFTKLIIANKVY